MADQDPLTFPNASHAALDKTLDELVDRANEVRANQGRLRALLRATQAVVEQIELPIVLQRIVESAVELVDAEYGAIGVIAPHGGLEQFIHVGMSHAQVEEIGHLPEGHGLLGALIDDPRPIRLDHLNKDVRSVGFPHNHPPMDSFLGVPIRVGDAVFGNLYLTNRRNGTFSDDDEQLVSSLAATAGFAVEHARLLAEARLRETWMAAAVETSAAVLASDRQDALRAISERMLLLTHSERAYVAEPSSASGLSNVLIAFDRNADEIVIDGGVRSNVVDSVFESGSLRTLDGCPASHSDYLACHDEIVSGAVLAVPIHAADMVTAVIVLARAVGQPRFSDAEVRIADAFASQASVSLELSQAREEQQRILLLDDRARIARDLHDHVIQQLYVTGLDIQTVAGRLNPGAPTEQLAGAVARIDDSIAQIRTVIFALSPTASTPGSVRHQLMDTIGDISAATEQVTTIAFSGPVDAVVTVELTEDITAVARECLTNAARHAHASTVAVSLVAADNTVTLTVRDDGIGIPAGGRRSGLRNIEERAHLRGGTLTIESESGTTTVTWSVPFPGVRHSPARTTSETPEPVASSDSPPPRIRAFLVDDHEVVRRGIADVLEASGEIEIVGEAGTVHDALARIGATLPDIAVLDVHLPDGSGIDLCRQVQSQYPTVRCVILTAHDDDEALFSAVLAGAHGYFLKNVQGAELLTALQTVAAGRTLLDPNLAHGVAHRMRSTPSDDPRFDSLGLRERQILSLIADGLTNRQIGERLKLAEATVKNYVSTLLTKLDLDRRTQAAVFESERRKRS